MLPTSKHVATPIIKHAAYLPLPTCGMLRSKAFDTLPTSSMWEYLYSCR